MPQLEKGGKWVFGWVVIRTGKKISIPPEAYREYGFLTGDEIAFTRGGRSSGEFGIGRAYDMPELLKKRVMDHGKIGEKLQVVLPAETKIRIGSRLLAVRGSRFALGFIAYGPI
jgi:hypothetical protein